MTRSSDARDDGPRVGSPMWIYLTAVTVTGAAVLAWTLATAGLDDLRALATSPLWWMLALLIVCGELRPIVTPGVSLVDAAAVSITFSFAALIYWGLTSAAVLLAVATLIAGAVARHAPFRNAFNAAQYTVSLGAAAAALALSGVHPGPDHTWVPLGVHIAQAALAAGVFFGCNMMLVAVAVALHTATPVRATIRAYLPYQLLVNVALLSASLLVVVVMNESALLVPLFLLPLAAVYSNAAMSVNRAYQAMHDELTGLPNRKFLGLRADEAFAEAARLGHRVGLLLLDLDRFKEVNDTLGHITGDRLLSVVAHRLAHSVRPGDLVARLGGDEFAVLLPKVRDLASAREVAVRLRAALAEPVRMDAKTFRIEGSVGIALHSARTPDLALLLRQADVAMYAAKQRRSGVEVYAGEQDPGSPATLCLVDDLRRALPVGQIELRFAPKVMLADGRPIGMEALVRWRHPSAGIVGPEQLAAFAEQAHVAGDLARYVVDTVLDQLAAWWRAGWKVQLALNVPVGDLCDPAFPGMAAASLRRRSLPPAALLVQVSERVLMSDTTCAAQAAGALAGLGIALSVDDFGTGYCSAVKLKQLPVAEVRIGASLVAQTLRSNDARAVVQSLAGLARPLGIRSVAAGVATASLAAALRQTGCDAAQGLHAGGQLDAAEATAWLADHMAMPAGPQAPPAERLGAAAQPAGGAAVRAAGGAGGTCPPLDGWAAPAAQTAPDPARARGIDKDPVGTNLHRENGCHGTQGRLLDPVCRGGGHRGAE